MLSIRVCRAVVLALCHRSSCAACRKSTFSSIVAGTLAASAHPLSLFLLQGHPQCVQNCSPFGGSSLFRIVNISTLPGLCLQFLDIAFSV